MATIVKSSTLLKRIMFINMDSTNNEYITLLLNGPHGVGKSQIVKTTAEDLGGYCFTVECSTLGMGELTGLPFAHKDEAGNPEVRYVPHYVINKVKGLQKYYYEKAKKEGFLGGRVRIIEENGIEYLIDGDSKIKMSDNIDRVANGEDNRYEFGGKLSKKTKMELIESGEIKLTLINLDEINRCELQTMKEIMNFILNRSINGYNLPWWCSIVASQNPSTQDSRYATNEMDDAQLSRFLKINVDAKFAEWVDYATTKQLDDDVIQGLVNTDGQNFTGKKNEKSQDIQEMAPDPRAWEMVCNIHKNIYEDNKSKFFSREEKADVDADFRTLVYGKVGDTAGRMLITALSDRANFIKPTDLLTGIEPKIDKALMEKFKGQKSLMQFTIAKSVCNYIGTRPEIVDGLKSADPKVKARSTNIKCQLGEFVNSLIPATQIEFIKTLNKLPEGQRIYLAICSSFDKETLANITNAQAQVRSVNEKK